MATLLLTLEAYMTFGLEARLTFHLTKSVTMIWSRMHLLIYATMKSYTLTLEQWSLLHAEFWCKLGVAYPTLTKRAYAVLVPFVTTYLC